MLPFWTAFYGSAMVAAMQWTLVVNSWASWGASVTALIGCRKTQVRAWSVSVSSDSNVIRMRPIQIGGSHAKTPRKIGTAPKANNVFTLADTNHGRR